MAPRRSNSGSTHVEFADATWAELASPTTTTPPRFDPATLSDLPAPAQRYLRGVLPDGVGLSSVVRLSMAGEIKLGGRWLPFSARQILRAGTGFVWAPVVGGRLLRFVGADALGVKGARLEFRLHGLIPVVRSSGPDVRRSAEGRLAAETVVWLPQALAPQSGARWRGIDDQRAVVSLDAAGPASTSRSTSTTGERFARSSCSDGATQSLQAATSPSVGRSTRRWPPRTGSVSP